VELEHLFNGSALSAVDAKGRLSVPSFIRGVIERRSDAKAVVIGMHEASPCLNAYDRGYAKILYAENERRRLAEESAGGDLSAHHARARRTFGLTEDVPYDTSGRIILPPMMRRKGQIEDLALFVGPAAPSKSGTRSSPSKAAMRNCAIWPPTASKRRASPCERAMTSGAAAPHVPVLLDEVIAGAAPC
jgi:MraZ protein